MYYTTASGFVKLDQDPKGIWDWRIESVELSCMRQVQHIRKKTLWNGSMTVTNTPRSICAERVACNSPPGLESKPLIPIALVIARRDGRIIEKARGWCGLEAISEILARTIWGVE